MLCLWENLHLCPISEAVVSFSSSRFLLINTKNEVPACAQRGGSSERNLDLTLIPLRVEFRGSETNSYLKVHLKEICESGNMKCPFSPDSFLIRIPIKFIASQCRSPKYPSRYPNLHAGGCVQLDDRRSSQKTLRELRSKAVLWSLQIPILTWAYGHLNGNRRFFQRVSLGFDRQAGTLNYL